MKASNADASGGAANSGTSASIDPREVELFGGLAADWWNPDGSSRLLHEVNPVRMRYIRERLLAHCKRDARARQPFTGVRALDVGCGGGILCEPLARLGCTVTGLDAAAASIAVAREHAATAGLAIDYVQSSAEALAAERPGSFDLVTCLEVVEHVADVDSFVAALARLLAPDGLLVFSTPNRTPVSYAVMIIGAERVLRALPAGAHDWNKFLTPEELTAALLRAGLVVNDISGIGYRPGRGFALTRNRAVNYIGTAVKT